MAMEGNLKVLLLGLMVATLVAMTASLTAEATVTIANPASLVVDVLVGEDNFAMTTDVMTVSLEEATQDIEIQTAEGQTISLNVKDGDLVLLYRNASDPQSVAAQVISLQTRFSSMKPNGIKVPPPKNSR